VTFLATTATKFITTTEARLELLPISNGQLIFVRDSRKICLDYADARVEYGQIIVLTNESHRLSIDNPFNAFYFVLDTRTLWRYENEWIPAVSSTGAASEEKIIFIGNDPLPEIGKENILYTTMDSIYTWNGESYTKMGALLWEEF
jgi:hypothetical protein